MPPALPPELFRLLSMSESAGRDEAWQVFVAAHSGLLLHSCRSLARDHDSAMDAYAYVLAELRENDCHRLRAYVPDARAQFTTWLVVVTRRLFLDYCRQKYGRPRSEEPASGTGHAIRRRLEDLLTSEVDPDQLTDSGEQSPDAELRRRELKQSLRHAIDGLDPSDRLLLVMRFEDERPVREIARSLRLPTVFHVYRRLNLVLQTLRRRLIQRGITDGEP